MKNSQKNYATRLEFAIPIVVGVLLLAGMPLASATNDTTEDTGVEDVTSPSPLSVVQSDYVTIKEKTVEETETSYQVDATIEVQFNGDCNPTAIRQLAVGIDETVEPVHCKNLGLGVCSPRQVDFSFEVPKDKVDSIVEEEGQATLIAVRHSGWSCSYATSNYWDSENEGVKVHRFSPGMDINYQAVGLVLVALSVVSAGGAIWYFKDEIPNM